MKKAPVVGVGAVVFRGDEVLLVRRGHPPGTGLWSLPGGKVRPGERLRDACRREVAEETGVRVKIGPLLGVFERLATGYHYVIVDYVGHAAAGATPRAGSDAADARWFPAGEIGRLRKTAGLAAAIRAARRLRSRPVR